jgi:hypothetical protein
MNAGDFVPIDTMAELAAEFGPMPRRRRRRLLYG